MREDLDIVVVSNRHRPALITDYLKNIPHQVSYTEDFEIPDGLDISNFNYLNNSTIGAYRCFKGHQEALKLSSKPYVLVFEDDAVPNKQNWLDAVDFGIDLLERFDVVSLHGRNMRGVVSVAKAKNWRYVCLKNVNQHIKAEKNFFGKWALGSLAYIVKRDLANQLIASTYDGLPMDLLLVNRFNACVFDPSPFDHDRKHGSLVDKPK